MGRKVLISGGSRGIGEACVRRFVTAGDEVSFIYYNNKEKAEALAAETGAYAICADIADSAQASEAVAAAVAEMGGIDVLVNNAGISQIKLFTDLTDEDWRRMLGVHLDGAFYLSRAAAREMIRQQSGRIINVGSMWGKCGASCEVHYSTAKAGLRGFTMALSKELGPSGITVNCVEPGVIRTDINAELSPDILQELCDETPLSRIGEPEEVASAVFFLASDEASFITGQIIGVDGGFAV